MIRKQSEKIWMLILRSKLNPAGRLWRHPLTLRQDASIDFLTSTLWKGILEFWNSEFLTTMSFACVNFRCQRDRKEVNQYFCQQAICMSVSYFVRVSAGSLASLCQTNISITCKFNSNNVSLCPKNKIALLLVISPAVHLSLFVQYRSYVY